MINTVVFVGLLLLCGKILEQQRPIVQIAFWVLWLLLIGWFCVWITNNVGWPVLF